MKWVGSPVLVAQGASPAFLIAGEAQAWLSSHTTE